MPKPERTTGSTDPGFPKEENMNRRRRRGASMLETMMVLCIMLFLFFSLFQVYSWVVAKIFCNYSAYYGGKGMALGYRLAIARRAARVAAIGISGRARDQRGRQRRLVRLLVSADRRRSATDAGRPLQLRGQLGFHNGPAGKRAADLSPPGHSARDFPEPGSR